MENTLISIITVVYNGDKYLEQTIQSVLNQTYKYIEYIIIDGGSTDRTLDIIKKYEENISYWVSEPDNGLYDAMNKGIKKAKGELIGMINSDDWYEPNAVALVAESFRKNPTKQIFHGDRNDVQEDGTRSIRKFNSSSFKLKYYGMTYNHPSMFISKKIYLNGMYNTNLSSLADYEFIMKHFQNNNTIFKYLPIAYVNYRLNGISGNLKAKTALKEGFLARKNAGLNIFQNLIALIIRALNLTIIKLK